MNRKTECYHSLIDCLIRASCFEIPQDLAIHEIMNKLNETDQAILSAYLRKTHIDAVVETMQVFEGLNEWGNMDVTLRGISLPKGIFSDMSKDYVKRRATFPQPWVEE